MPCKGLKGNEEKYKDCLAQLGEICLKYSRSHMVMIGGDFNEDIYSGGKGERRACLQNFVKDCSLDNQETEKMPSGCKSRWHRHKYYRLWLL